MNTEQLFTDFRVTLTEGTKSSPATRAFVSCKVADAVWLTGIRVVEGVRGKFVAMPCVKNKQREFQDVFFPASREMREALQTGVLQAFVKAVQGQPVAS